MWLQHKFRWCGQSVYALEGHSSGNRIKMNYDYSRKFRPPELLMELGKKGGLVSLKTIWGSLINHEIPFEFLSISKGFREYSVVMTHVGCFQEWFSNVFLKKI